MYKRKEATILNRHLQLYMIEHNLYIPLSTEDVLPDHSTVEPESIIRWAADKFLQIPFLRNMTLKLMTVKIICQNFKINYQLQPPLSSKKKFLGKQNQCFRIQSFQSFIMPGSLHKNHILYGFIRKIFMKEGG